MEQKAEFLFLECQFEKITKEIEDETQAVFSMIFLMLDCDVQLDLKTPKYLNLTYINLIQNFGRTLKQANRRLFVVNSPLSLNRFLQRFKLDRSILVENYS